MSEPLTAEGRFIARLMAIRERPALFAYDALATDLLNFLATLDATHPSGEVDVRKVQMRMLRRQDGCEQSHRGHDWHVHEPVIERYEYTLRAALDGRREEG